MLTVSTFPFYSWMFTNVLPEVSQLLSMSPSPLKGLSAFGISMEPWPRVLADKTATVCTF